MRTLGHSPADIMTYVLVEKGLATLPSANGNWPVYAAGEPNTPDNLIVIYDTQGYDDGSVMNDGELQGHYGFQVQIRGENHPTGWAKANTIRATLAQNCIDVTVTIPTAGSIAAGTYLVQNIAQIGDVLCLGKDISKDRTDLFTVNAVVSVDQVS